MNSLHIGFSKSITFPPGGFLCIDDTFPDIPKARMFDPLRHSFNPLKDITYKSARELADALYTVSPQGEDTLTVRNGKRALLKALINHGPRTPPRFDRIASRDDEVTDIVSDILASPILRQVLCGTDRMFSFNPNSQVLVRLDRSELGDFDALVLGLLIINHYKGQLVIPDLGFYGRDAHMSLIRQQRLIAGIHFLGELPLRLRQAALLIKDKHASHALIDDARTLAAYAGMPESTNAFSEFVEAATR
ncbi:MAG: hypothetical protein AB7V13_10915 [Pseudorhodoplanes sp.]